jgi:glycerophosphoryl diester phosphodiesterase
MRRLWILIFSLLAPFRAIAQETSLDSDLAAPIHRLELESATQLRELFRPTNLRHPFVSGHRGGAQIGFPENCLETFERTLQDTFAILEVDPRYSKDGVVVLHHDATLDRTTDGHGKLADFTLAELKQLRLKDIEGKVTGFRIPTLDEAIQWARGKTVLVLDQKDMTAIDRVKKITEYAAEAYVMIIVNSFRDAQASYSLNPEIMMEVMIPNLEKAKEFDTLAVPWRNVVAFVGHTPPDDPALYEYIHQRGASCMIGTSRNLDRKVIAGQVSDVQVLAGEYQAFLNRGADIIETDIPCLLGPMLFQKTSIGPSKQQFFKR